MNPKTLKFFWSLIMVLTIWFSTGTGAPQGFLVIDDGVFNFQHELVTKPEVVVSPKPTLAPRPYNPLPPIKLPPAFFQDLGYTLPPPPPPPLEFHAVAPSIDLGFSIPPPHLPIILG